MAIMERLSQKLTSHKAWSIQLENEKEWDSIEKQQGGFPAKRRYKPLAAREDDTMFIWEREWDSMAEAETAYNRLFSSPQARSLMEETQVRMKEAGLEQLVEGTRREYFSVLE